ncbi:MAG: outer membrane protein transport protein [Gemmataceae bacterium]|nr:outer membrane protein transport protein [Gemmataceae bacterium]
MCRPCLALPALALIAGLLTASASHAQQGIVLSGVGPINRSMAGAATAAPIDACGALNWNPASIAGLERSELEFGLELLYPTTRLSSNVPANALGAGIPPTGFADTSTSDGGIYPLPTIGLVYQPEDSRWSLGLGIFAVGGFGVNYAASATNPFLQAPPPLGLGVGPLYTELQVMQVAPTAAYWLTDRLAIGVSPTLTLASLRIDPNFVATPDVLPGGVVAYPRSAHARISAGGGVQAGIFYVLPDGWQLGASVKSPQRLETFYFNSQTSVGAPLKVPFNLDYPLIASAGVAYSGLERWLFAVDFRWVDYENTDGFRQSGFGPDGAVQGLGWRSIFAVLAGVQYQWTDSLTVRAGYSYNQNPVPDAQATINTSAPSIIEHVIYAGASWRVSEALLLSAAYAHGFENAIEGSYRGPTVIVPGSSVRNQASADTFLMGATVQFGPCRKRSAGCAFQSREVVQE